MDKSIPRSRDNPGHSFEVLPDLCPYEVDMLTKAAKRSDSIDVRRRNGLSFSPNQTSSNKLLRIFTPTKQSILYYDGRAYNQLGEHLFALDPCKYYRNIQPFEPQRPVSFIPAPGHYQGLGKPPVRQFFKLTMMRVNESRLMPSYELLDKQMLCPADKNSA